MSVHGHNPNAFDNWYRDPDDNPEGLAEFQESIRRSDALSRFALEATKAIVSDDAVDADLWLSIRGMNGEQLDWGIPQ